MISKDDVRSRIHAALNQVCFTEHVNVYVFGSTLTALSTADDVDVLVVYSQPSDAQRARHAIEDVLLPKPLDLIMMTVEEEVGYRFLESTSTERVYP